MLREETLWSITVAYWCCAISAAVVKICVPSVDDLLRYGLRRQQHRHKHRTKKDSVKSTSELSIPFFLRLLLDPIHGIPPLACWASFYAFAFANSCVLYAYYYHYHSRGLISPKAVAETAHIALAFPHGDFLLRLCAVYYYTRIMR